MKIKAHAKINLTLNVVAKRNDGYHELDMIMVPLTLCDELTITVSDQDEIICDQKQFPMDKSNTIYRAISLMRERFSLKEFFKIEVIKRIPMQAGLAGGSADGAATLKAIVQLCQLDISENELISIAKKIGADVPFCVINEASRVQGIGEKITRFQMNCPFYLLLVKPEEGVSTKEAFANIDFTSCVHPDVEKAQLALMNNEYRVFCDCIQNTLEPSAFQITPGIETIKKKLEQLHFDTVLMSGSGSSVFAITRDQKILHNGYHVMKEQYLFVDICEIYQ